MFPSRPSQRNFESRNGRHDKEADEEGGNAKSDGTGSLLTQTHRDLLCRRSLYVYPRNSLDPARPVVRPYRARARALVKALENALNTCSTSHITEPH